MYQILKTRKWEVLLLIFIIMIGQVGVVISATINANALNELIKMNWNQFLLQEIYLMLVWAGVILADWLTRNYQMSVIQNLNIEMRDRISSKISKSSYQLFHSQSVGSYVSWLNNDIQTINKQAFEKYFLIVKGLSGTVFAVVTLIKYHWSLVLVTLVLLIIMLTIPKVFAKQMKEASLQTTLQNEEFLKEAEESLGGFEVFASLNLLNQMPRRIHKASITLKKVVLRQTRIESVIAAIGFSGSIFFQILLTIFTGYLAYRHIVSIGTIEATGALTGVIFTAFGDLSSQLSMINGTKPIFKKLEQIRQSEEKQDFTNEALLPQAALFEAQNLSYQYGNTTVFTNLSFEFLAGGKYLLLGQSGSGKSTLLKLLNGFLRDYSGSLKFYGRELKNIQSQELINRVLLLGQKPYLFAGTVRDNIRLEENFSDDDVISSLRKAGLSKEISQSDFLDFQVGDDGKLLSGGQRQRLTLARGLIRNKKIILIDEGTSAVDNKTSIEIEQMLLTQKDLTVIMITHNPHSELTDLFTKVIHFPEDLSDSENS